MLFGKVLNLAEIVWVVIRRIQAHCSFFQFELNSSAGRGLQNVLRWAYFVVLRIVAENTEVNVMVAEICDFEVGV
jgi:hypothetical protein